MEMLHDEQDCKCWQEGGVETLLVSSAVCENPEGDEDEKWVVYEGYVERCKKCKQPLGQGFGDPFMYPTEEAATKRDEENKEKMKKGWT